MTLTIVEFAASLGYYERKGAEVCTYLGCKEPAQLLHCQCKRHAEKHRARNRKHMRTRRAMARVQLGLQW